MKEVAAEIASPLTYIFNKSLQDGCVPHMWKCSNVTPVHKGGSVDDPSNYQPISVVSVAAKVLEKLIATQLQTYLEKHKLLHPHQGAYRHGRSVMTFYCMLLILLFRNLTRNILFVVPF